MACSFDFKQFGTGRGASKSLVRMHAADLGCESIDYLLLFALEILSIHLGLASHTLSERERFLIGISAGIKKKKKMMIYLHGRIT